MKLDEKIAMLRKKNGWSQEELAFRLNVSRQAVSKWEMGASIPDIENVLKMSELFGCSTDYLLKETGEQGDCEQKSEEQALRKVEDEEGERYLLTVKKHAKWFALGVALCILSPVCLLVLLALAKNGVMTEGLASGLGVGAILLFVALGVGLLIRGGIALSPYEYLDKEEIVLSSALSEQVRELREKHTPHYTKAITLGVILCILAVIPSLLAGVLETSESVSLYCVSGTLVLIACGVGLFVGFGNIREAHDKLLQEKEYSVEHKREAKRTGLFSGVYWCVITAIYLAVSFVTNLWDKTWIIWPVAGVLFGGLYAVVAAITKKK